MWSNNYIGIPFKYKGRDENGIDCWGLVRLIYKNEYNISLPSFGEEYAENDISRIQELISQYKEGWESIDTPTEGTAVLFRILGAESHIGVAISNTHFIHARDGYDSAIESFNSPYWKRRIVGHFKYSENKGIVLNAIPHPLRTTRYTVPVPPNTKLDALANWIIKEYSIAEEIKSKVNILVNGKVVEECEWSSVTLKDTDVVEYRAIPTGGNTTRLILTLAVMYVAVTYGADLSAAVGYTGTGAAAMGSVAISLVGTALVNYIAPIRPPDFGAGGNDAGSAERQLMANGAQNRAQPYSAIPVVLGKVRVTPPLGAINYLTYENERDSYLSMLLTWGYGPLTIDSNSFRIGEQPISNYTDYSIITLDRKTTETSDDIAKFNAIYGKDITQVNPNLELVCDGNPETSVPAGPWAEAISTEVVQSITVALHFPQGLRKIAIKGEAGGTSYATAVSFNIEYYHNNTWTAFPNITVGGDAPKKDAFTFTKTYSIYGVGDFPVNTNMSIRIRRITGDNVEDNPDYRYYHQSFLQSVAFSNNSSPAVDPLNAKIAKSALKIKATDQLNGSIEGINAIVQTYCKAWNGSAWVETSTSNPAALFRYVLEHPANAQKITDPSAKFDLVQLQHWATYCNAKGFEYNAVLGVQRSVLEVLRDICAAGRASPALVDGKWTITIDEEKPNVIQHFTPHNSWGFESTKSLPKLPDGLRVTYYDENQNYQECEIIVYASGKNETNSELFESIQLPGCTKKSAVIDHARWHMAQAKLRPEIYTLNSDIEYLVCNRGDRVKVMHDVPLWGLGSGRIKNRISDTVFELDEDVPMQSGVNYTIRVRSSDGTSVVRNIVPVSEDNNYSQVTLTTSATESQINASDLFMFGELNSEANDLIILSIEPTGNKSARLTLVDYGVTEDYNIFNDYQNLTNATVFDSKITLPPKLLIDTFGNKTPTITGMISDESVMELIAAGIFRYNLVVSYVNAPQLPKNTGSVEAQYDYAAATDNLNLRTTSVLYEKGAVSIPDVVEGENYKVRLRYTSIDGRIGQWSDWQNTVIVGKTRPPQQVSNFTAEPEYNAGRLRLTWNSNPEVDIKGYEVRTEDANWGSPTNRVFYGTANNCSTISEDSVHTKTYFIRAFDYTGNYSTTSAYLTFSSPAPASPSNLGYYYGTTSNTNSTVTFTWRAPASSFFSIKEYKVVISRPEMVDEIVYVASTKYTTEANWLGNATLSVIAIDTIGSESLAAVLTVPKYAPDPIVSFNTEIVDNNVLLKWQLPATTSLPISHILIKRGPSWTNPDKVIGEKDGTFTSIFELTGGVYTYWLAVVDTDERESTPVAIPVTVSQPPDFVFNAEYVSTFNGTKVNAEKLVNSNSLLMLVNTTDSWFNHFDNNSWDTPQEQIDAGYPIYAQPSLLTASYTEIFDYEIILASSSITVSYAGTVVSGNAVVELTIQTSADGTNWSAPQNTSSVFATNFRYIKVVINTVGDTDTALYSLDSLIVRLDNKQVSDSGNVVALSTDTLGTIVNFNKEMIDVQSINLTPAGTTPLTAVYDFSDDTLDGTYSVTSGVCTVTANAHELETGQRVKLFFSTGTAITGVYTITKLNANQYTVSMVGQPNTSGDVITYPQSMRVYVFNSTNGTRQTAKVGWSIKGY